MVCKKIYAIALLFDCAVLISSVPKIQAPRLDYLGAFSCTLHESIAVTPKDNLTINELMKLIPHHAKVKADALKQIKNMQGDLAKVCSCNMHPKLFLYTADGAVIYNFVFFSFPKKNGKDKNSFKIIAGENPYDQK